MSEHRDSSVRILFPNNWRAEHEAWDKFLTDFREYLFPTFQKHGCTLNTALQAYFSNVISTTNYEFLKHMSCSCDDDDEEGDEWKESKTES